MPAMTASADTLPLRLRALLSEAGAARAGFTPCTAVDDDAHASYLRFIADGRHGAMAYMANHLEIRRNPALLLEDGTARSIVMCAFPYYPGNDAATDATDARFALYARGEDYHAVLRRRLAPAVSYLEEQGYRSRICIDSAPLRERYWAVRCGLGFIGLNSQLIVPGLGSYFFLSAIITEAPLPADEPCTGSCGSCGRCVRACPTGAIGPDGSFDARRCLSYLTIEYRGELPPGLPLGSRVYGCDSCQLCCPHNRGASPTPIAEFHPSPAIASLTRDEIASMTRPYFRRIFALTAVRRLRIEGLRRNALYKSADFGEKC